MTKLNNNFNDRIIELLKNRIQVVEVKRIIYKEFGIYVSNEKMKKIKKEIVFNDETNSIKPLKLSNSQTSILENINYALSVNDNKAKTIEEIIRVIEDGKNIKYKSQEIKSKLSNKWLYKFNKYNKKYSLLLTSKTKNKTINNSIQKHFSEKEMIIEVMKENNKPLMAKEISALVYQKFNKEKLSWFSVRKIIRTELKESVEYSKKNLMFTLISKEKESIGANTKEEEILISDTELFLLKIKKIINEKDLRTSFINKIKKNYINVNSGDKRIDQLINSIVKDNVITDIEEQFLLQKIDEYKLSKDILDQAKKSLYMNNPYLDNLIHLIYEDGIITNTELVFLKEKVFENGFYEEFVNNRFWQIGIMHYLDHLLNIKSFETIIILWLTTQQFIITANLDDIWLFNQINIFGNLNKKKQSINSIIEDGLEKIEKYISTILKEELNISETDLLFKKIYKNYYISKKINLTQQQTSIDFQYVIKIIQEEKYRLGTPDANLMAENIIFRLEN